MNNVQYLLICLAEEAGEFQQSIGKCQRFGFYAKYPENGPDNVTRLVNELNDMIAVFELLMEEGVEFDNVLGRESLDIKKDKVKQFMEISKEIGILDQVH